MITRLILTRHGSSHHKEDGVIGGPHGCRGLTTLGRSQAEALARRLAQELNCHPAPIYCSVIPRAIETAEIIATELGQQEIVQECGLCTWHTPTHVDGKPWDEYRQQSSLPGGGVYRPFEQGNESWSELVARTGRALEHIAGRHVGETVVIVTHAEAITGSFIVFGLQPLLLGFDLEIQPASITEWITDGNPNAWPRPRWKLVRFNEHAHMGP